MRCGTATACLVVSRVTLMVKWGPGLAGSMVEQHFCLRWNNYRTNITAEFETLREGEHFVDVTLACDGQQLKAHKVVLSACSPYFKELLQVRHRHTEKERERVRERERERVSECFYLSSFR
ncbi:Broad-complex core protein isoforms 1/2/3/4/5 [Portunus trituberculatus]|uniref:Broad-complex core protein isoforms 1/2/3/4/5 n=1 Tax=Portunus trituberculatus TaxID=210409 RepID=A0A5B7HUV2_PORTR|nr:Broad-complex core protein isoforms 1/2/3/4/5 [Portunus trituberculatus]